MIKSGKSILTDGYIARQLATLREGLDPQLPGKNDHEGRFLDRVSSRSVRHPDPIRDLLIPALKSLIVLFECRILRRP